MPHSEVPCAETPGDQALVAFFSRAGENYCAQGNQMLAVGHTRRVAEAVAAAAHAPMLELVPETPYPEGYDATVAIAKREWEENLRPALSSETLSAVRAISKLRILFLGFPIWCGTFPRHTAAFLDLAREAGLLEGVVILPFCTQEGSGFGNALSELARLAPHAILAPGLVVQGIHSEHCRQAVDAWLSLEAVRSAASLGLGRSVPGAQLLASRRSLKPKYLAAPAPGLEKIREMAQAAMRVPDHGCQVPWRIAVIPGQARERLGELYAAAARRAGADDEKAERARGRAFKGPMILAFIVRGQTARGVARDEALLTAGAALGQFMQALSLEGFGGIVLSGSALEDEDLQKAFCRDEGERVAAWITVGTPAQNAPQPQPETREPPVSVWEGS